MSKLGGEGVCTKGVYYWEIVVVDNILWHICSENVEILK